MNKVDLTGQRFGKLTVIGPHGKNKWGNLTFLCICSCGKEHVTVSGYLRSGRTTSCGCMSYKHQLGKNSITHGFTRGGHQRFYNIFMTLKSRCENPKSQKYSRYGGRGIKNTWKSFEKFKEDMFVSYNSHIEKFGEKETTIDRIDNNGNYIKSNCRWATLLEQSRNNTGKFKKGQIPWNKKK